MNSLPKPVLEPVTRTTCLEFMLITPCLLRRYRAATTLMPEARFGYRNEVSTLLPGENELKWFMGPQGALVVYLLHLEAVSERSLF